MSGEEDRTVFCLLQTCCITPMISKCNYTKLNKIDNKSIIKKKAKSTTIVIEFTKIKWVHERHCTVSRQTWFLSFKVCKVIRFIVCCNTEKNKEDVSFMPANN